MIKFLITVSTVVLNMGYSSLAFAIGDYLSFGIASGASQYTISSFSGYNFCWNRTNGSNNTLLTPGGHIMCNVPFSSLGAFSLTLTNSQTGDNCTIISTQNPSQITTGSCSLPGVVIADQDPDHKKFRYGDWQVNLQ